MKWNMSETLALPSTQAANVLFVPVTVIVIATVSPDFDAHSVLDALMA